MNDIFNYIDILLRTIGWIFCIYVLLRYHFDKIKPTKIELLFLIIAFA